MGVVWRARDERLRRDVAVKQLSWPPHFTPEEQRAACSRAAREAQVAARLSHRNVIRVFDTVEEDDCPWLVMELLPPRSLHDLLKREGPLDPARAATVGLGILAALRAAHAAGIVHQDVKPTNILMAPDRVVLIDFGIAQAAGSAPLADVGVLFGSASYIAPERARGEQAGPPADLWGLGATLYAAVEGHGPFERHGGARASLAATADREPEPAAHAGPALGPVISGLLRREPGERLDAATAEQMLRHAAATAVGQAPLPEVRTLASGGPSVLAVTSPMRAPRRPRTPARSGAGAWTQGVLIPDEAARSS